MNPIAMHEYAAHEDSDFTMPLPGRDELTGLPNGRMAFDEFTKRTLRNPESPIAILFLDMDCFRAINEISGYKYGNKILVEVAQQIEASTGEDEFIARLGSDKFIVLIPQQQGGTHSVRRFMDSLSANLANLTRKEATPVSLSFSIGVTSYPEDGREYKSLLRSASIAMYKAKDVGHCSYSFFSAETPPQKYLHTKERVESALQTATINNEFSLVYQPLVSLASGEVNAVEALIRWKSATLGEVPPIDFIPISESNRLIIEIGEWVLKHAFIQAARWANQGFRICVAVNVSPIQVRSADFVSIFQSCLEEYPEAQGLIEIELTETTWIKDMDTTISVCKELGAMGIQIAIDDFGAGYSSLAYLSQLPAHKIKIDKALIDDSENPAAVKVIRNIISLGRDLGKIVVAEGVETEEQMLLLQSLGMDTAQGYFFCRPVSPEEATNICLHGELRHIVQATGSRQQGLTF